MFDNYKEAEIQAKKLLAENPGSRQFIYFDRIIKKFTVFAMYDEKVVREVRYTYIEEITDGESLLRKESNEGQPRS